MGLHLQEERKFAFFILHLPCNKYSAFDSQILRMQKENTKHSHPAWSILGVHKWAFCVSTSNILEKSSSSSVSPHPIHLFLHTSRSSEGCFYLIKTSGGHYNCVYCIRITVPTLLRDYISTQFWGFHRTALSF